MDGLTLVMTTPEEVRRWFKERTHWFVVFLGGFTELPAVDALDAAIGRYPTFGTIFAPGMVPITVIPKAALSPEAFSQALKRMSTTIPHPRRDQDIAFVVPTSMPPAEIAARAQDVLRVLTGGYAPPLPRLQLAAAPCSPTVQ